MKSKKNILLYLSIFFLMLYGVVIFLNYINCQERISLVLENRLSKLETNYKIFVYNQEQLADNIYEDTITNVQIIEILTNANQTKDDQKLALLRDQLNNLVSKKYEQIHKRGVLQYHFVFPDNKVFLRVHKPAKYGDSLAEARQDFEYVNLHKTIVRGFSQGRTSHGFRNVYPIFGQNEEYLGAIEISFASELLQEYLQNMSGIHSHFLIDKHIFDTKAWEREDVILTYQTSAEHDNLMIHLTPNHTYEKCISTNLENIKSIKEEIAKGVAKKESFVLHLSKTHLANVISFYPIEQNITKEVVAWIVSYEDVPFITTIVNEALIVKIVSALVLLVVFYFIYKNMLQQQLIRKSSEELLEKTQEQETLLSLFDKGDSVLFKWNNDSNWTVEHVSLSVKHLLGYEAEDFIKQKISYLSCVHKDDLAHVIKEVQEGSILDNDFFAHQPYRVITKDNEEKWVLDYTTILRNNQGKILHYIGYIVDITEHKNKERLLFEQSKLAAMGEMIGNIAHQWRQPLSVISTSATGLMMQHQFGMLDETKIVKTCEIINENAQYLSATIDDFRNFIKGERVLKEFDIGKTIESFLHLVEPSIKSHNITVITNLEKNIVIKGYENELQQCFINIFNNAKDALKELDSTKKRLFFVSVTKKDKNTLCITFCDSGLGIPTEILNKVFEPYFTTKHKSQGTGLGLHMTYNIITSGMGGVIQIENQEYDYEGVSYKGAMITIEIPITTL